MHDIMLLATMALLGWLGYKAASASLCCCDVNLARALGLPVGVAFLMFSANVFAQWLPLWVSVVAALALLVLAGLPTPSVPPQIEHEPYTRPMKWILALVVLASIANLWTTQLSGPNDEFWMKYPLVRSMLQGNVPPVNPYFPESSLTGHYSQHVLTACLSLLNGGDAIRTEWILEFILIINSIFLWALTIRQTHGKALASVMAVLFMFMGVNVGSQVGLMDAFSHNDLLTYLLLAVLVSLYADIYVKIAKRWPVGTPQILVTILITGTYGTICETHLVIVLACFSVGCFCLAFGRSTAKRMNTVTAAIVLGSLLLAVFQSNANAIRRFVRELRIDYSFPAITASTGSPYLPEGSPSPNNSLSRPPQPQAQQRVPFVVFPKKEFLAIRLGLDPYQRVSSALDTALFRRYKPVLDDGGYSSIFSGKVFVLHWFPLWLAPLTIVWAIRRRSGASVFLAFFGIVAYLTPGLFDFGPARESEYMRYEFASGLSFAALLGIMLAELWKYTPRSPRLNRCLKITLILFVLLNLVGAQRLLNNIVIKMQKSPTFASRVTRLWYPDSKSWLLSLPEVGVTPEDVEVSDWLWHNAGSQRRLLSLWFASCDVTNLSNQRHESALSPQKTSATGQPEDNSDMLGITPANATSERHIQPLSVTQPVLFANSKRSLNGVYYDAALSGMAGTFPVGHAVPPQWQTSTTAPLYPSEPTVVFCQTGNPEVLAGMGVNWVVSSRKLSPPSSRAVNLELVKTFGALAQRRYLYRVVTNVATGESVTASANTSAPATSSNGATTGTTGTTGTTKVSVSGIPAPGHAQAGVAYPITLRFDKPVFGWVKSLVSRPDGTIVNLHSPISVCVAGRTASTYLALPLEEGDYTLRWEYAPDIRASKDSWLILPGQDRFGYTLSSTIEECLRVERIVHSSSHSGTITLKNTSATSFDVGGPLRVQWWVWDAIAHNYLHRGSYEGEACFTGVLGPQETIELNWLVPEPIPTTCRLDVTASATYGPSIAVPRIASEQGL